MIAVINENSLEPCDLFNKMMYNNSSPWLLVQIADCTSTCVLADVIFVVYGCWSSSLEWIQEHIPVDEVFQHLRCTEEGLSNEEAEARLQIFGFNKLEEKSV